MSRSFGSRLIGPALVPLLLGYSSAAWAGDVPKPVSFLEDIAPILTRHCVGCHNVKKAESKYDVTTYASLAKGGRLGQETTLVPGEPDESNLVELIRHDGEPRMPYRQDPLPAESVALIARWVKEGAKYDGDDPREDWLAVRHKRAPVVVPERYGVPLPVSALAFSPDGTAVATAGDHEVNVWRRDGGALIRRLRGVPERVYAINYSADGQWLATAGGDPGRYGSVTLWLAEPGGGGKLVRHLLESTDAVFALAFSADSAYVAAAGSDRAVRVWETATGKLRTTIEDHADWILDVAFSPDGRRIATASRDRTSKVFDVATRETIATFAGHAETVYTVAFTPDGRRVATGGADNLVRIWDPSDDAKQVTVHGGFTGAVLRLRFSPNGKHLAACSTDRSVRVFSERAPHATLSSHADWVHALAFAPDGNALASGSWNGDVRLWDVTSGAPLGAFLAAPGLATRTAGGTHDNGKEQGP